MYVCLNKNSSQTVNGSDLKFAHIILCATNRSTVLFSTFKFSNFHLFLNHIRALNSRATERGEHCAPTLSNV